MPRIFLGYLHIPGIFAGIQVFFRVNEQDFVQNHDFSRGFSPSTPILMLNIGRFLHIVAVCRRAREGYFARISIFRKFQVFVRGNYFFQVLAPCRFTLGVTPLGSMCLLPLNLEQRTFITSSKNMFVIRGLIRIVSQT